MTRCLAQKYIKGSSTVRKIKKLLMNAISTKEHIIKLFHQNKKMKNKNRNYSIIYVVTFKERVRKSLKKMKIKTDECVKPSNLKLT